MYIVTMPYEAAVTKIESYNIHGLEYAPAMEQDEYKSKIPKAIYDFAENVANDRKLLGSVGKMLPYVKLLASAFAPLSISGNPSLLYNLPTYSILDQQLYPYNSYYQFFNRTKSDPSTIIFTINQPLETLISLIRQDKMSVYIGGNRENEFLVEGLSSFETTEKVTLTQNGHWSSSGGRYPDSNKNIKYGFTLEYGSKVTIKLDTSYSTDAYLYLLNEAGKVLAQDDDDAGQRDSLISEKPLAPGDYTIVAATYRADKTDDFILTLTGLVSNFYQK